MPESQVRARGACAYGAQRMVVYKYTLHMRFYVLRYRFIALLEPEVVHKKEKKKEEQLGAHVLLRCAVLR